MFSNKPESKIENKMIYWANSVSIIIIACITTTNWTS